MEIIKINTIEVNKNKAEAVGNNKSETIESDKNKAETVGKSKNETIEANKNEVEAIGNNKDKTTETYKNEMEEITNNSQNKKETEQADSKSKQENKNNINVNANIEKESKKNELVDNSKTDKTENAELKTEIIELEVKIIEEKKENNKQENPISNADSKEEIKENMKEDIKENNKQPIQKTNTENINPNNNPTISSGEQNTNKVSLSSTINKETIQKSSNIQYSGTSGISFSNQSEPIVTYNGSDNNYLSKLWVENYTLNKEFSKENTTYFMTVQSKIEKLDITASVEDSEATICIYGNENLKEGINKILISVTAENGNVRNYRIYVTKNS